VSSGFGSSSDQLLLDQTGVDQRIEVISNGLSPHVHRPKGSQLRSDQLSLDQAGIDPMLEDTSLNQRLLLGKTGRPDGLEVFTHLGSALDHRLLWD
jgi:hypothetical protein